MFTNCCAASTYRILRCDSTHNRMGWINEAFYSSAPVLVEKKFHLKFSKYFLTWNFLRNALSLPKRKICKHSSKLPTMVEPLKRRILKWRKDLKNSNCFKHTNFTGDASAALAIHLNYSQLVKEIPLRRLSVTKF